MHKLVPNKLIKFYHVVVCIYHSNLAYTSMGFYIFLKKHLIVCTILVMPCGLQVVTRVMVKDIWKRIGDDA
jgi:hypothetical protein